jgi:hypothetical protein
MKKHNYLLLKESKTYYIRAVKARVRMSGYYRNLKLTKLV